MTDACKEYAARISAIQIRISRIQVEIAKAATRDKNSINWAHVGDLSRILSALGEANALLTPYREECNK